MSLTWSAVIADDLAGYQVYYRAAADVEWLLAPGGPISGTTSSVSELTNGTEYLFALTAVDTSANESAKSAPVSATPVVTAP